MLQKFMHLCQNQKGKDINKMNTDRKKFTVLTTIVVSAVVITEQITERHIIENLDDKHNQRNTQTAQMHSTLMASIEELEAEVQLHTPTPTITPSPTVIYQNNH